MLSVVIIAKNEQDTIGRAIESVSWADEILLIDNNSTDKTVLNARHRGAHVIRDNTDGDFAHLRNTGLKHASSDWVFFLDADEWVTPALAQSLQMVTSYKKAAYNCYMIGRQDVFWGHTLSFGETFMARTRGIIRLVKKESGVEWKGAVHEQLHIPVVASARLDGMLMHTPHPTIASFLNHINYYSSVRARELARAGRAEGSAFYLQLFLFPPLKFIYTYVFLLGFLDGAAGFVYSFMMSFHSFLVRAKWYQTTTLAAQKTIPSPSS
jgi:glycosyltransferase involved in cell wall biosynthesis